MTSGQAVDTWGSMVSRLDGNWIKGFFFVGDELLIERRINVSLEALEPLLLTAYAA